MLGRGIYALGGAREAAERAGFNVTRIQYFIYGFVGLLLRHRRHDLWLAWPGRPIRRTSWAWS